MSKFSVFQQNNLLIGTSLAAELPSSAPELRAFVTIGSYVVTARGTAKPPRTLNRDLQDLRFRVHKYEIHKNYLGSGNEIAIEQLTHSIFKKDISSMEQLEREVEKYLDDFSLLIVAWKFDPSIPFK